MVSKEGNGPTARFLIRIPIFRHIGTRQEIHIEWSSFDEVDYLALYTDNKIERALCRNDDCDFPQWIFGTCAILSRDCSEVLTIRDESEMTFSAESDEDEDKPGSREGDWRSFARKTRRRSKPRRMRHTRDRDGDDSKEKDGRWNTRIVGPGIRVRVPNRDKDRHDDNKDKAWDIDEDNNGLLAAADVVLYPGTYLDDAVLSYCRPGAELVDTQDLTLDAMVDLEVTSSRAGRSVVRLTSGDPSIYSALTEQTRRLDEAGVAWDVCPGVRRHAREIGRASCRERV